ncbi:MAG: acyl carrier protein [Bdellovibrionaceae bacterium]|nr:acyl carrier protein [Pseudobdellovibrionaceae bacterium]
MDIIAKRLKLRLESTFPKIDLSKKISDQLDSLQLAVLLNEVESEFGISVPSSQLIFLKSIDLDALTKMVSDRLAAQGHK